MATLQSTKKAIAVKRENALYNWQQVQDFKAKKRTKRLNNEQHCLRLVSEGKGKQAILSHCKKVYKDKQWAKGITTAQKQKWIAGRCAIYLSIAVYQFGIVEGEQAKEQKVVNV